MSHFQHKPPVRKEPASSREMSALEQWLDGKDELLLYITAALGVLLPGIVYIVYYKLHKYYQKYAERKHKEQLEEEAAQSEAVVIHLGTKGVQTETYAKLLHEKLTSEMCRKPALWSVDELNTKDLADFKGFAIFIVETLAGGRATSATDWFLEWLEDVAADARKKKKTNFDKLKFAILGVGSMDDGEQGFNKTSRILLKRLKILGSKQIMDVEILNNNDEKNEDENTGRFVMFCEELMEAMDRNLPGAEPSDDDCSIDGDSELSEEEDKKNL